MTEASIESVTEQTVFDDALALLDGKFTYDPAKRKGGYLTAYAAVKLAFGVHRDDHAIAYNGSRWRRLADEMARAFDALDEVTAESSDNPVSFIVWGSRPSRTYGEVEVFFHEAALRQPDMAVNGKARLRPAPTGLGGARKVRWVICSQLAMIANGRDSSLGAVMQSILPLDEMPDIDVIEMLDIIMDREGCPWEKPIGVEAVVALSRAWGIRTRNDPTYSLARFVNEFPSLMWTERTDGDLLDAFESFVGAHKADEAPVFGAPFLG